MNDDLHLLVYTSEYTGNQNSLTKDLNDILEVAKRNNAANGITGVMFHQNGRFLQFLEGEESQLRKLTAKLKADNRHRAMEYLFDESLDYRGFPDWSMDCFQLRRDEELNLEFLELIRDSYRRNFKTRPAALVQVFKGFINESVLQ
ncbi:MAG: BLUF domain-containing protein [Planctomycetaceae bacterium]|nr:BLUF domain-containing protein [Planctomycetaceae bacterium]